MATQCPECKSKKTVVEQTRPKLYNGQICAQRCRKCAACNHTWRTLETPMSSSAEQALSNALQEAGISMDHVTDRQWCACVEALERLWP